MSRKSPTGVKPIANLPASANVIPSPAPGASLLVTVACVAPHAAGVICGLETFGGDIFYYFCNS
jgi:hypothetical protein